MHAAGMHRLQHVGMKYWLGKGHFGKEGYEGFADVCCCLGWNGNSVHSGQRVPLGYASHSGHSLA